MEIIINRHNLLCCIRSSGLLSVSKCRICDPDFIRHIMRHNTVIECNLWDFIIMEQIPEHIRRIYIHQWIHVFFQFQKICVLIQTYFSIFHDFLLRPLFSTLLSKSSCIIVYTHTCIVNSNFSYYNCKRQMP